MKQKFIMGFVCGALLFGVVGVCAGQYVATENSFPIKLNGQGVDLKGYIINDNTYFKLRDIGKEVGFDVNFNDNTILITTEVDKSMEHNSTTVPNTSSIKYESIDGSEYISVKDARDYIDTVVNSSGLVWNLAWNTDISSQDMWCILVQVGSSGESINEYNIDVVSINNQLYIPKATFEKDVLGRI